jgi:hypothetical protein
MPRQGLREDNVILLPQLSFLIRQKRGKKQGGQSSLAAPSGRSRGAPVGNQAPVPALRIVEAPMREAFHIGQLVRISRPASGYADHRTYCIVCLCRRQTDLRSIGSRTLRGSSASSGPMRSSRQPSRPSPKSLSRIFRPATAAGNHPHGPLAHGSGSWPLPSPDGRDRMLP